MRHITVPGFGGQPCGGEIERVARRAPSRPPVGRSLPIVGQGSQGGPADNPWEWVCQGCGQRWSREPLPDEAL